MITQGSREPGRVRNPQRTRVRSIASTRAKRIVSLFSSLLCLVHLVVCSRAPITAAGSVPAVPTKSRLLKHDRIRLIEALAQEKPHVTLLLAAQPGMNNLLVAEVRRLNGTVQYRDDDADYVRAEVPTRNVQQLSSSTAIESLNLAGKIDYLSYPDQDNQAIPPVVTTEIPAPDRNTPAVNPYLPSGAIGAPQFIAAHPTFDGRGVVVAVIDTNIDFLLPELQTAKAIDGTPVPKFADIFSAAPNALVQSGDDSHIAGYLRVGMQAEVAAREKKFSYQNRNYVVPDDGRYRIGTVNERLTSSSGDLNRDGNPSGSSELFGVLWNESTNTVLVDTNQNLDFTDEKPMTDYRVRQDIGVFGKDDPKTAVRETVGFTVQIDAHHKSVFVIPGYGLHGTGVSGAAFGAGFFGGKIDGVAPAAQIISIPPGRGSKITVGYIEAVITAMKDPRVDLVSMQFGNFLPQNDGRATFSIVCNRLVKKYGKLLFAGAGNGNDGLNGIISPADAREVIAIGSYVSRETSRVNYGVELRDADNMNGYTSHGPTKEGGLKPNLLAPASSLSTRPGFMAAENRYGTYPLQPGYQIFDGTSTSTPFAAAGAALLISAAKQSGVKYDARRLRWAITSSARFLPKYSVEMQGAGLMQVQAAWEALKQAPEPIDIVSRAPVKAVLSDYLQHPNQGTGIFEREGWAAGQSGQRILRFTRTSGRPGPMKFLLRWTGNNGTFASPPEITLPLNTAVDLKISISPRSPGLHTAILNLVGPNESVTYQVMNTVVAAEQLNSSNGFTITRDGQAEWLHSRSYFVNVPAGTPALKVDVRIAEGNVMPSLTRPNARFYYSLAPDQAPVRYTGYQTGGTWSRVVTNPDPGVWQITVDNCNVSEKSVGTTNASFTVTAALLGVKVAPLYPFLDANFQKEITYSNTHASFVGAITSTALASAFIANATVAGNEPIGYEIDVAPGATRVGATLSAEDGLVDLDLYLFDCTGRECMLRDFSNGSGSSEQVAVESPAAGKWKLMIDPFLTREGTTRFRYKDYFLHRAFGSLDGPNESVALKQGSSITQRVNLNINAVPVGERYLEALFFVTNQPGPNTVTRKDRHGLDLYYADKGILGTASLQLRPATFPSASK